MHKLDPNDMDALFREGAKRHEFTYNPDAWAMMEEKLDNKNRKKYFLWFFMSFLLLGGVAATFLLTNVGEEATTLAADLNNDQNNEDAKIQNSNNTLEGTGKNETTADDSVDQIAQEEIEINNDQINIRPTQISSETAKRGEKPTAKERIINTSNNSIQSENIGSLANSEIVNVSSQDVKTVTSKTPSEIVRQGINQATNTNPKVDNRSTLEIDGLDRAWRNELMSMNDTRDVVNLDVYVEEDPTITNSKVRYVVTAFGSSDLSSVGFFSDTQSGFTTGIKVGAQLARKFQIDLGFAYSLKQYGSEGINYNVEGGWNTMQGVNPTWMDGKGNILEIPLEATYYINGYENNSFFVNAGISSFLFNSEWYGFKYDPEDLLVNPNALEEITMDDITRRNFHLAGVARLSVGYQRVITSNMAVELAPYLQIPLTGIGEGKVDLYTAGIQFAVKFNTK